MQDFSLNQIKKMEQEATRRAREYNSRAKLKPPLEPECNVTKTKNDIQQQKRGSLSFLNAFDIKKLIGENSEQAMLLLLILILANDNNCDEYLIYALIYIML